MESFLKPMLAEPGKMFPVRDMRNWMMEPKLDGWRYVAHKDEDGALHCYGGRNGADHTGQLPYLEEQLADLLPDGTAIDGELIGDEEGWGTVQSVMTSSNPNLDARPLSYVVFDLTRLSLRDVRNYSYEQRTEALTVLEWDNYPELMMSEAVEASEIGHQDLVNNGFEGSVWKRRASSYVGARSSNWIKFKYESSGEAIVTGFKPGQGEFAGMIGAIEFEFVDTKVPSRASGMDLTVRQDMTDNPARWIGSVIEVKHNGIMRSGKPRHPRYLRRRDDRSAHEFTPSQHAVTRQTGTRRRTAKPSATKADIGSFPGASKRNYGAMADAKLMRSIDELGNGAGEAYSRCVSAGCDPHADYNKACTIAEQRGLRL